MVEFDRRRELEQALTVALQSEKLPALSIVHNRQLEHFTVQSDVRFLQENKKEHAEMEVVALDKAELLAQVSQIFTELNLKFLNPIITNVGEKGEDIITLKKRFGQALDSEQR